MLNAEAWMLQGNRDYVLIMKKLKSSGYFITFKVDLTIQCELKLKYWLDNPGYKYSNAV